MNKTKSFTTLSLSFIILSLYACGTPSPTPTPTSTPTPTVSVSPTPNPTPTPATDNSYNFPLKVTHKGECNNGDRAAFEVKSDKTFWYLTDDMTTIESRTLTNVELTSLKNLLEELDLAKLALNDAVVPDGSPQTDECRTVEHYSMMVNNNERSFDYNSRTLTHSQEYLAAVVRLRNRLNELKNNNIPQSYDYTLPIRVTTEFECGEAAPLQTHDVKEDGTYSYNTDSGIVTKNLTVEQVNSLDNLLETLDIAKLAENDAAVPHDAPQTTECRTIEKYIIKVNSSERAFDRNSRQFIHTQEYINALNTLKARLEELKR